MFEPGTRVQWNAIAFKGEMFDFSGDLPKINLPMKIKATGTVVQCTADVVIFNGVEGKVYQVKEDSTKELVFFHETQLEEIPQ